MDVVQHELFFVFQLHTERESGALLQLRLHIDLAAELLHDFLGDGQTKPNTFLVYWAGVFDKAKQFEQIFLVFFRDSISIVYNLHENFVLAIFESPDSTQDHDSSMVVSELERVGNKVKDYLLYPLRVRDDHKVIWLDLYSIHKHRHF